MNYHSWRITQIFSMKKRKWQETEGRGRKVVEMDGKGRKWEESGMTGKGKPSVHPPAGC